MIDLLKTPLVWLVLLAMAGVLATLVMILFKRRKSAATSNQPSQMPETPEMSTEGAAPPNLESDPEPELAPPPAAAPASERDEPAMAPPPPPAAPAPKRAPEPDMAPPPPPAAPAPQSELQSGPAPFAEKHRRSSRDERKSGKDYAEVNIFYATDRAVNDPSSPKTWFSGERGDKYVYGSCTISIPLYNRKIGELPSPKWYKLQFSERRDRDVMLVAVDEAEEDIYFKIMHDLLQDQAGRQAFIFVHGYNVNFEDAARRTGQIAFDLSLDILPILYSWPSQGSSRGYAIDEENVRWSVPHLRDFIKQVLQRSGAERLHLIAHSMGNRAMTEALRELLADLSDEERAIVREIILVAPDIDAGVFVEQIAPAITGHGARVTLYAAEGDKALDLSQWIRGELPRAGDLTDLPVFPAGLDLIDATECDVSILGHTPFKSGAMIKDLFNLLVRSAKPSERHLSMIADDPRGKYWKIRT